MIANLTRSRPFRVNDLNAFTKEIDDINRLFREDNDIDVTNPRVLLGTLPHWEAVYLYTTEPGWPDTFDIASAEDQLDFDFFDRIASYIADGQVAIFEEVTIDNANMIEGDIIPTIRYTINVVTNEGLQDEFDSVDKVQDAVAQLNGDLLLNTMY